MIVLSWKKNLGILACFVGTAVGTMHVINRVFTHIATAYNYLDGNDLKYYDWRFGRIAYKRTGSGSPVLLVHNFDVCSSMHEWKNIEAELSKTNTPKTEQEIKEFSLAENLRLVYVAITRAKKKLYLTVSTKVKSFSKTEERQPSVLFEI